MKGNTYQILLELAGIPVRISLQYEDAYRRFLPYSRKYPAAGEKCAACLKVDEEDWTDLISHGFTRCGQVEASYLSALCSDVLLSFRRCVIHAAAFRDADDAWLIAAPPGTGKSTQVCTLKALFPGKYEVICGDRPVLQLMEDGTVTVHPSPWNGKENWGGAEAAPLRGLICLRRGGANAVSPLPVRKAGLFVYQAIIQTAAGEEEVRRSAAFADSLLRRVPVWEFINQDIPDSTRLLYETVLGGKG